MLIVLWRRASSWGRGATASLAFSTFISPSSLFLAVFHYLAQATHKFIYRDLSSAPNFRWCSVIFPNSFKEVWKYRKTKTHEEIRGWRAPVGAPLVATPLLLSDVNVRFYGHFPCHYWRSYFLPVCWTATLVFPSTSAIIFRCNCFRYWSAWWVIDNWHFDRHVGPCWL